MTNKEKVKAYIAKISEKYLLSNAELGCAKQGYIDGLKEGRKDIAQKEIVTVKNTYNELFGFCKELELKNKTLNLYISRGGFIKDRNGKWCKEGDKVRVRYDDVTNGKVGVLVFSEDKIYGFGVKTNEYKERGIYSITSTYGFELIEPCEPDICNNFEEE